MDRATWPHLKERLREILLTRTRDEWCAMFDGTDACVTPVLTMGEAIDHPHNASRGAFPSIDGMVQPAPAPRYSHTPLAQPRMPDPARSEYAELLAQLGYDQQRVDGLRARGIVA